MGKFFVPTNGKGDWQKLLADPEKQWRSGYSAKALACCWEEAGGFPKSVQQVFSLVLRAFHLSIVFHKVPRSYPLPAPKMQNQYPKKVYEPSLE